MRRKRRTKLELLPENQQDRILAALRDRRVKLASLSALLDLWYGINISKQTLRRYKNRLRREDLGSSK